LRSINGSIEHPDAPSCARNRTQAKNILYPRLPSLDWFPGTCSGNENSAGAQECDCRQLSTDANRPSMTDPVTMKHENVCELERMGASLAIEPGILPMVR
jgi:hypothetical protein